MFLSFRSRHSQQIPAKHNFIGSVEMFVKDSDSRSDVTSECVRSSSHRQKSSGILHHTASKKEVLPETARRPSTEYTCHILHQKPSMSV